MKGKFLASIVCISILGTYLQARANLCNDYFGVKSVETTVKTEERVRETAQPDSSAEKISPTIKQYTLESFFETDPGRNIAISHPATLVSAAQKYAMIINVGAKKRTRDPVYKIKPLTVYDVFAGNVDGTGGKLIVGQEEAIHEVVNYIYSQASGSREGKIPILIGPHGTGKTEALMILDALAQYYQSKDARFAEYTFEWKDIEKIPSLAPLLPSRGGENVFTALRDELGDSPFVLLRQDMQEQVLSQVSPQIESQIGFKLRVQRDPASPKTAEMLQKVFEHYVPEIREGLITVDDISRNQYLDILSKHIRVVKKVPTRSMASNIIRAVPENPNYSLLFAAQDLRKRLFYPEDSALMYNFTGKVLRHHRGSLSLDEFFRNDPALINLFLELFQNGIMETDTGPAVKMDAITVLTSNNESVAKAKDDGAVLAILDRMIKIPMRWDVHPHRISKISLLLVDAKNFKMRKLPTGEESSSENFTWKPVYETLPDGTQVNRLNELYPIQNAEGNLVGAAGRYAVSYRLGGRDVLIAPHTLEMLGTIVSATRLVTDASKMKDYWSELNVVSEGSHFFTSVKYRMDIILGKTKPEDAVLKDLTKMHDLVEEGREGISARDTKRWLEKAMALAVERGNGVLTPYILDMAFKELMDKNEMTIPPGKRAEWLKRYQIIKQEFILPALYADIRNIISGDGESANRMYDVVEKELVALSTNEAAREFIPDDASEPQPINRSRLEKIKAHYKKLYGREFQTGFLLRHLAGVQGSGKKVRDNELLNAIQSFITEQELDLTVNVQKIGQYYRGETNDPKVERMAQDAESRFARYGYDRASFIEAVSYFDRIRTEKEANDANPNR